MSDTLLNKLPIHERVQTEKDLLRWVEQHLNIRIPTVPVCSGHHAPFDYLRKAYFEPSEDLIVWAPRGGGKTRLAAIATLLDLLHKPGIAVRVLGGSMQQSLRMWEHLLPSLTDLAGTEMKNIPRGPRVRMNNGASAEAIPHSQRSVRGMHIQKLRCDEVELFDRNVFEAAKLTTRSITLPDGTPARGTIECISTMHNQWGLMQDIVEKATEAGRPVIKWCILDVLEKCPPERPCEGCPLHEECRGRARNANGFVSIDDAIASKARVSRETWEAEMLCHRPSAKGAVFPTFNPDVHVREIPAHGPITLGIDFGFRHPFACLWIADDGVNVHVIDEYVQSGLTMDDHVREIELRQWAKAKWIACDPAGNGPNQQTAETNTDLLRRAKYSVMTCSSRIADGLELIRIGLRTGTGQVSLYIHPRCVNLIKAMRSYHFSPGRQGEVPDKDGEHDHVIDALRYFYVNRDRRERNVVKVSKY